MKRTVRIVLLCLAATVAASGLYPRPGLGRPGPDASRAAIFLPNDPRFNPWSWPLDRLAGRQGVYACDIHIGFLNTDYFCDITPDRGVDFVRDRQRTTDDDVTRRVLARLDACDAMDSLTIRYGVGDISPDGVRALLPRTGKTARIEEGKQHGRWGNPETHAKVLQLSDGQAEYYTVHGSLNLQTVGLTCKGNNALRFVERRPALYAAFTALSEAAGAGNGQGRFPGGHGSADASGTSLPPIPVGNYLVSFYAGRGQAFVGGRPAAPERPWPLYLNAPSAGQHEAGIVNWYDAALFDAAAQLRQGRDVRLDVAVFEIGETAWFVEHLFRFVDEGFAGGRTEDRESDVRLGTTQPGNLTVRFLWQFQSGDGKAETPTTALLRGPSVIRRLDPATGHVSVLAMARVWPRLDPSGITRNPGTPHDMHNKLMLLDVAGHEEERRIYVTSSNLDTPGVGSGQLWQAGTIIAARPGSGVWSGENAGKRHLFNAYSHYFDLLWDSREGQPEAGQVAFHERIVREHLAGEVNWIETVPPQSDLTAVNPREGIDAFFFPVPLTDR
ncbi:hypothetical protein [Desulfovibrio sp. TomC]|uniref:hypothetical protein n=1 Tax=Desulfovibrio sp. TomC TaxID=1562888 RepID=UPI0005746109|nr:hypothetical protein [Desulfovibrio sp. TomC]KHK03529.1 hypothetical protein NY78_1117 [Desulfovibrio sp. TomC]